MSDRSSAPVSESLAHGTRPLLVTIAGAAEILSLSRSSIYQLIWNDQLTPIRIGRCLRFPVDQLEQFVADRIAASRRTDG
ncbi:MAG TPA: helix-turn-helix domain-containing protein [Ilumatobacteraceae bacterium]|nr:helix-turn-helix domain-containing protein [Ilumatobacteraceae bacterium]